MEIQKTALRLPKPLHKEIHKSAKKSGRSMNSEIVMRLQASFKESEVSYDQLLENITDIIEKAVKDK